MATSGAILTGKSLLSRRFMGFSRTPTSQFHTQIRIQANPFHTSGFRGCSFATSSFSSCSGDYCPKNLSLSAHGLKSLNLSGIGAREFGSGKNFQMSAVSGGGGGGNGGSGDGNSGGGDNSGGGSGGDGGSNWSLLAWYLSLLEKYPVLTKAVTSALLTLVGDVICQLWIDQVTSLDVKRTFLFTLLGLVLVGPTLHFWYFYLSTLVTTTGASGAFLRLLIDQFIFAPIFVGVFLSSLLTLEGRTSQVIPKLQQEWLSSVIANWQLWVPFQFINFLLVPQPFQVLAANFIAVVWNVILSYKAHKEVLQK